MTSMQQNNCPNSPINKLLCLYIFIPVETFACIYASMNANSNKSKTFERKQTEILTAPLVLPSLL